jgi:hypothetical protein
MSKRQMNYPPGVPSVDADPGTPAHRMTVSSCLTVLALGSCWHGLRVSITEHLPICSMVGLACCDFSRSAYYRGCDSDTLAFAR